MVVIYKAVKECNKGQKYFFLLPIMRVTLILMAAKISSASELKASIYVLTRPLICF